MNLYDVFTLAYKEARYQYSLVKLVPADACTAKLDHMLKYSEMVDDLMDLEMEFFGNNAFSRLPISPFDDRNVTKEDLSEMYSAALEHYRFRQEWLRRDGSCKEAQLLDEEEGFMSALKLATMKLGEFWNARHRTTD